MPLPDPKAIVDEAREAADNEPEEVTRAKVAARLRPDDEGEAPGTIDYSKVDDEKIFQEERERVEKREAEIDGSWSARVVREGKGREAWRGARATLHVTGRLREEDGAEFEDSRVREEPHLLLLGRGTMVPGLDKALLTMKQGERSFITVAPEGGYGAAGSHTYPLVPGSCTLVYDVEVLKLEEETDLWDQTFAQKMTLAEERRARGNRLFKRKWYEWADQEYEQALRYLVFNPHPSEDEKRVIAEQSLAVQLNLAATKLRCNREREAIGHAEKALEMHPEHPKALYRTAQAHTQLGEFEKARRFLERAKASGAADDDVVKAVTQEHARVDARKERHRREQKRAYARMVSGGASDEDGGSGGGALGRLGGMLRRSRAGLGAWAAGNDYGNAMALACAAVVLLFAMAVVALPRLLGAAPPVPPLPRGAEPGGEAPFVSSVDEL